MTTERKLRRDRISVELDRPTRERIEQIARLEKRSLSNLISLLLDDWSHGRPVRVEIESDAA